MGPGASWLGQFVKDEQNYRRQMIPEVTMPYAINGFICDSQHLELHLEIYWKSISFFKFSPSFSTLFLYLLFFPAICVYAFVFYVIN